MELVKISIVPDSYKLNFGLNSEVGCTIKVIVTDFNGNGISNYPIIITCPDDTTQTTQTAITNNFGWYNFEYTFNDANGTGYRRFVVNDIVSESIFLYRDTGWVDALTYRSGYTLKTSGRPVMMRVVDKTVQIEGFFTNSSAVTTVQGGTGINFAIMKYPKFAPSTGVMRLIARTPQRWFLELNTSGNFFMGRHGTTATNTQIPANSWLECSVMYTID